MVIVGLGLLAVSIWYLPWRVAKLLGSKRSLWPWRAVLILVMGCYLAAMHFGIFATGSKLVARLYLAWAMVFVFELYLFIILAAIQILGLLFRKVKLRPVLGLAAVAALSAGMTLFQLHRTQGYVINEYVVPVPGLKAPVRLMHFVDLHLGSFRGEAFLKRIRSDIDARHPDIVIWNGDLATSDLALSEELFGHFKNAAPEQYFTTGNHELQIDTNRLLSLLEKNGIKFLRSSMVETHGLQLIGLEYMNGDSIELYDAFAKMATDLTIADVLPRINRVFSEPTVVFHHSPVGLRHAAMGEVDVMLTGNAHTGQQAPLITMFRLSWPTLRAGQTSVGHMILLVSSGGGEYASWFRLGSPYEFQVVDLIPG